MAASAPGVTGQSDPDPLLRPGNYIAGNGQAPTPAPASASAPAAATVVTPAKRKSAESDMDWLPQGWKSENKVRTSGATAGSTDKYYYDPVSGRKFRSKKEVLYFLQTGQTRKRVKGENADTDTPPTDKKPKPVTEAKGSAANFNFSKVPDKVQWVLTDSPAESWNAIIDGKQIRNSSKLDWLAAFTFLASKDRGRYY